MSVRTDVVNLIVQVGGDKAQSELNQLRKKAADLNAEMKGLHKNTTEYKNKAVELKAVDTQMAALRKQIGLTALSQKELTAELKRLQQLKNITTPQSKEFHELQRQIDGVTKRLYEVKNGVFGFGATLHKVKAEVKQFGMLALSYLGFEFITDQFKKIISGAGKLSDQLADLQRVAGLTSSEAQSLNQSLRGLDTRTSGENLRNIAIIAGKLGVAKNDILEFTKAVDMLVVSLGDELGDADTITTELGKILNVFDGNVTGQNITTLGNAIVELANAGVASGGFITDFTQRVSGIAKASNLSLGATVGLAAGFEELGLRSESSSTALQKLLSTIAADIPKSAKIANVPVAEFNKLFAEQPQQALIKYAQGLVKNKQSFSEITASFKDAGEEGARVVQTLQAIGQRGEFLSQKIELGTNSLKESTAITEAYRLKNENLGGTLDKIGKRISAWFTSSGFMKGVEGIARGFADLIGATDSANNALGKFKEQADRVNKLEKDIIPLLNRYDELKSKTNLSKDEQVELNKAINTIATTIPSAITEFDKYGKAIGVSTEAAREFIKIQGLILKEKNKDAISEQNDNLKDLQRDLGVYQRNLAAWQRNMKTADKAEIDYFNTGIGNIVNKIQTIKDRITGVKGLISELSGDKLANQLTTTDAGVTTTTNTTVSDPGISDKEKKSQEKALNKLKDLRDKILAIRAELEAAAKGDDEKEKNRIHQKYVELLKLAVGHAAEISELHVLERAELELHDRKVFDKRKTEMDNFIVDFRKHLQKQLHEIEEAEKKAAEDKKKRDAEYGKRVLEQAQKDLKDSYERGVEKKKVQDEEHQLMMRGLMDFLNNTMQILDMAARYADIRENNELNRYLNANEKKKASFDKLLAGKRISQAQYEKEIAKLDKESEKRKHEIDVKQFKRHQAIAYMQAIINAALGITQIWSTYAEVPYVAAALTAIEAIATGIQIATIAKQEPPMAKKGLIVSGPSHDEGGIGMVDNRTGQTLAEIEGGEPVMVLSKNTYGNNKALIDELIYNSQNRNGASVMPRWTTSTPRLQNNIIPMMEKGGVWGMAPSGGNGNSNVEGLLIGLNNTMQQVATYMAYMPTRLKAEVVYQEFIEAENVLTAIKKESGLQQSQKLSA